MAKEGLTDAESYRRLFERLYQPVAWYFRKRGFSAEEAQDLAQDVFVKAYDGRWDFRREASETTWIFRIAANTLASELRSRTAGKRSAKEISLSEPTPGDSDLPVAEVLADEGGPSPFDRLLGKQHHAIVEREIAQLPAKMRLCLLLRVRQDLSYDQIAVAMRLSAATVKVHLFQGRKRLKAALARAVKPR